jgi:putative CocE/NonD family hydrolase
MKIGVGAKDGVRVYLCAAAAAFGALTLAACGSGGDDSGTSYTRTTLGTRDSIAEPIATVSTNLTANASQPSQWQDYNPDELYPKSVDLPLRYITMRDGIQLATYITLPADADGNPVTDPLPTILIQTAYNGFLGRVVPEIGVDRYMVKHGYATVIVDVRGTGQSFGEWKAFDATEQADYTEAVNWVKTQPWFNGSIALQGYSYLSITSMLTAEQGDPAVKAGFAGATIGDGLRGIAGTGAEMNAEFMSVWMTLTTLCGIIEPQMFGDNQQVGYELLKEHLQNAATGFQLPMLLKGLAGDPSVVYDGDFWSVRSPLENTDKIKVPVFEYGGLWDIFQRDEPLYFERLKGRVPVKLLINPADHLQGAFGLGMSTAGLPPLDHIQLQWFDQYVKGMNSGADQIPNVTQYMTGLNKYVVTTDWPHPAATAQRYYLHGDTTVSASLPEVDEPVHKVTQDVFGGICSPSASVWSLGILGILPVPCLQNDDAVDKNNANFETAPMMEPLALNGPIEADIYVSSTADEVPVSVRVDDVQPDGTAIFLTDGLLLGSAAEVDLTRARTLGGEMIQPWHAFTQDTSHKVGKNNIVQAAVEIFPTSAVIETGHRLRISIGSGNLPQGLPPGPTLLQSLGGTISIYNDAQHPSSVVLPVVPMASLNLL